MTTLASESTDLDSAARVLMVFLETSKILVSSLRVASW